MADNGSSCKSSRKYYYIFIDFWTPSKVVKKEMIYTYILLKIPPSRELFPEGYPLGVMVNAQDCGIVLSEFEL